MGIKELENFVTLRQSPIGGHYNRLFDQMSSAEMYSDVMLGPVAYLDTDLGWYEALVSPVGTERL